MATNLETYPLWNICILKKQRAVDEHTLNTDFSGIPEVYFRTRWAELPAVPISRVAGARCICFQLTSTSSVTERLSVPLLSGESGAWWAPSPASLRPPSLGSGPETLACGQVGRAPSISRIINSVSRLCCPPCCTRGHPDGVVRPAAAVGLQFCRYRSDALMWRRSQQHQACEEPVTSSVAITVAIGSGEAAVIPVSGFPWSLISQRVNSLLYMNLNSTPCCYLNCECTDIRIKWKTQELIYDAQRFLVHGFICLFTSSFVLMKCFCWNHFTQTASSTPTPLDDFPLSTSLQEWACINLLLWDVLDHKSGASNWIV